MSLVVEFAWVKKLFFERMFRDGPDQAEAVGAQCSAGHEAGPRVQAGGHCGHRAAQAPAAAALAGSPAEPGRHASGV